MQYRIANTAIGYRLDLMDCGADLLLEFVIGINRYRNRIEACKPTQRACEVHLDADIFASLAFDFDLQLCVAAKVVECDGQSCQQNMTELGLEVRRDLV